MAIRPTMLMPSQYAEKFPATRPERIFNDAPPSREEVTTSCTCRDSVEVNTLTSSGMIAPASVPHEMMIPSFHHSVLFPASVGIVNHETMKVITTETIDVIHTSDVSGASKFMRSAFR